MPLVRYISQSLADSSELAVFEYLEVKSIVIVNWFAVPEFALMLIYRSELPDAIIEAVVEWALGGSYLWSL